MHYEKKGISTTPHQILTNAALAALTLIIIILLLYIYAPPDFWGPIKFIDTINALAQIATAAAFFLAIHQYRKNKESDRQKALIDECKTLVTKMKADAEKLTNNEYPTLSAATTFMEQMSNHAGNFNGIFQALNEDIHKAIVRMHWQDMYFIELTNATEYINRNFSLMAFGVRDNTYYEAIVDLNSAPATSIPPPLLYDYYQNQYLASLSNIKKQIDISRDHALTIFLFEQYFFDNDALKDHLYGCINKVDIRVRSPLIAVINEQFESSDTGRDPHGFKAFWPFPHGS